MKRTFKKLLAVLLTVVLILGMFPATVFAVGDGAGRLDEQVQFVNGYIPVTHTGTTAVTDAYLRGEALEVNGVKLGQPQRSLPSSYDSRNYSYITSVKNQNPYGSCWAHAAMASVESYMIKHGIKVGTGSAATTSLNLSETQHCFFNYTSAYDAEGMLSGDKSTPSDGCLDQGGNGEMSAYTLMRWTGSADESQSALAYSKASTVASSGLNSQYAYRYDVSHVQNTEWIPASNIAAVKQAIMDYGAGNISYYETGSAYTYICTIDTSSQSSSSHKWANHAITVVGWDDSIAVSNFKPNKPSSTGAWLCKNSWGTSYFNQGYCWISYEDTSVLEGYIYFYDAESIDNYDHNYQYDGSCNVVTYGVGNRVGFANNTKVANVFTAKGSELLRAVAFCSWDEGMTYTVDIYKNPTTGNPSSGTLMSSQSGTLTFSGYYTIPLNTPVSLSAGDTFSVVVTQNVPEADDNGKYVHTPYDATFNDSSVVSWCSWTHANHGNTSYYKEPNGSWTDCPDNGDYRIKAFTDDVSFTVTAVSNNTSYGTVSVSGNIITASPKSGYYVASCDVTSGSATCTINGNTITVSASSDCTVRVNFAAKPTYTVNFVALGVSVGSQSAQVNDSITLPASASAVDGYAFIGWTAAPVAETTAKPSYYAPGASYTVTSNATLYALYSRVEEGTGGVYYQLLSAAPSDWAGSYVITYGTDSSLYVMKGVTVSSNGAEIENTSNAVSLSSSGMTLDGTALKNVSSAYVFNVAPSGSYYTIRSASTNVYVGETSSNYLGGYNTYSSGYCDWTIGPQTNASSATCVNGGSYPYLSYNTSNNYFWTQGSNGISNGYVYNVRWWKETNASTTYYNTDPVVQTHEHQMTYVAAVAATCTEAGHSAYYYCAGCGKYFSDAAGNHEITLASTVIAATGHNAGSAVVENNVSPTCTAAGGYDNVVYCTKCGAELSRTHVTVNATGHSFGAWTTNSNGTHSRTCSACGSKETVNCSYNDVVTPPTATEQGYTTHTCTVCGYSFVDSYTDPIGQTVYYTVSFSVPGGVSAVASQTVAAGTSITLPSAGAPAGYTFLGWVTSTVDHSASRPTSILTGSYAVNADVTLKALYVCTEGGGEVVYEKLQSAPADWSGKYVITYGTSASSLYVLKGLSGNTSYESTSAGGAVLLSNSGMSLSDGKLSGVTDSYVFNVAASGSKFTIRSESAGTYLGSYNKYLYSRSSYSSSYCQWALSVSGGNVTASNSASSRYPYLAFSGSKYFMVSSSAPSGLSFWKQTASSSSTWYTTEIGGETPQPEPTYTVSFSVPAGVAAVASQTVNANAVITLPSAGAPSGYTFLGWVTADVAATAVRPSDILTGSFTVTGSITLKALYSYAETGAAGYQLVTSAPADWSGNYVITYGNTSSLYALKGISGNTRYESASSGGAVAFASTGMSLSGSTLSNVGSAYVFSIAASNSKYSIRSASTGTYLSSYSNYLYSRTSLSSSYGLWSFAMNGSAVKATNSYSSRYPYLAFSGSGYFMINSSSSSIYFWKEAEGGTTVYYTTLS